MAQGEPNDELAKDNLLAYLDDLTEIAKVKVLGMYEDLDDDWNRTLYVVGRSPNQPYQYFWRKCDSFGEDTMCWNGWERIEMGVSNDHVMPFVFENLPHIA